MDGVIHCDVSRATAQLGHPGYLTIDLAALGRNYEKLSSLLAPSRAAAVVKANAYGLGAERVATVLYDKGCRHFFVAHFIEAIRLKPLLPSDSQLFVLNGLQPGNEKSCAENGIVPVLNSMQQWDRWSAAGRSLGRSLPAVLQFDTGMSRLGFPPEERPALAATLKTDGNIEVLFIMSHLACADELDATQNNDQLDEMMCIADEFAGYDLSLSNSGGVFLGDVYHGVLARPGIALYGGAPTAGRGNPMEAVVGLKVAVIQTRTVSAGTKVGYGGAHTATGKMRLATIAAGYADGLPRSLSDRGAVYFEGIRLPIVGRVSMDSITIDISHLPEDAVGLGSLVEVLGPNQTLDELASDAGTISYEILTSLGQRYERCYR